MPLIGVWGRKMKNKVVAAFKNQIEVAFIVAAAIIIAPIAFIVALVGFAQVGGVNASGSLTRPVSQKLGAMLRAK